MAAVTAAWNDFGDSSAISSAFAPIAGPPFPTTIAGYDDASWKLYGVNYVPRLQEMRQRWDNPKMRFRVVLAGHPRRVVRSRWIALNHLSILKPENQHWNENDRGLPQAAIVARTEFDKMDQPRRETPKPGKLITSACVRETGVRDVVRRCGRQRAAGSAPGSRSGRRAGDSRACNEVATSRNWCSV